MPAPGPVGCQALPCAEATGPLAGRSQRSWLCGSGGPGVDIPQLHHVHVSCAHLCLVILLFYHNFKKICILDTNSIPYVYMYMNSLRPHGLYSPWNSPDQNTGVGSLSHLQGIFPTQGANPGLQHCRQILYQLSYQGSPIYVYI